MTESRSYSIDLPTHWVSAHAWVAFEIIELMQDQFWEHCSCAMQQAMRDRLGACDPGPSDEPFF